MSDTPNTQLARAEFEAYAIPRHLHLPKRPDGEYASVTTQEAWTAWQAARSSSPAIPEGWISVETKLPEDETPVIILRDSLPDVGEIRWERPTYEDTYNAFRYWDSPSHDGQDWEWHSITHWMPLPKPPVAAPKQTKEQG